MAPYDAPHRVHGHPEIPLWQLVRASTAAPVCFPPECVTVGKHEFRFVDGAITGDDNPSFHTMLLATAEPYRLGWPMGEKAIPLVSVGTGTNAMADAGLAPGDMNILYNANTLPSAPMFAAQNEQELPCRTFGNCLSGAPIDREVGDMCLANGSASRRAAADKLFTYVRYNADLSAGGLAALGIDDASAGKVQKLDAVDGIPDLQRVGRAVAERDVRAAHFDGFAP